MQFGLRNCGALTMQRGKIARCEGIELPDGEVLKEVEPEGYTYLEIVELDKIKETEMKQKIIREYKRRLKLILKSKPKGNKITAMNTRAVFCVQTRKMMTMYGAFHPKSDVHKFYLKRCEGSRGLISIEYCIRGDVRDNCDGKCHQ